MYHIDMTIDAATAKQQANNIINKSLASVYADIDAASLKGERYAIIDKSRLNSHQLKFLNELKFEIEEETKFDGTVPYRYQTVTGYRINF